MKWAASGILGDMGRLLGRGHEPGIQWNRLQGSPQNQGAGSLPPEHTEGLHFLVPLWLVGPCDQPWPVSSEQQGPGALWS